MHLTSLYSKAAGRETLPAGSVAGRIVAYDDVARTDDNWNVQAYYREKSHEIDEVTSVKVLETGPVRGVLCVERRFRSSLLRTCITAYAGSAELRYDYEIDWHEHNLFVKAEHPVDVNAKCASYDIQFGHIQRPVHKNTLWDFARFEVCGHKYADLSDGGFGLALLTDCKYGYDASRSSLNLSLLKCSTYPDKNADIGQHRFAYALYPHGGDLTDGRVREHAYAFNYPAQAAFVPAQAGSLPSEFSLFRLSAPNIVLETVKKAEDSDALVLRMYEAENKRTQCILATGLAFGACAETDLMEQPIQPLEQTPAGIPLTFRPFEIKTVLLHPAAGAQPDCRAELH